MKSAHAKPRYVLGLDFGTLSGRALLVDVASGREVATAVHEYGDGVLDEHLPQDKKRLPFNFALQNPADYLEVLSQAVPRVLRRAKATAEQVLGVGTDFTSCTMLPTDRNGTPLCFAKRWRKNPHAWVKLWKHHAAQPQAECINEIARQRGEPIVAAYGGRYSSEWFFSKLLETVEQASEIYDSADRVIEAGDWIVWQLCGAERRSQSAAGFKAMWVCPDGHGGWTYPDRAFFRALHPKLEGVVADKLSTELFALGSKAGGLTREMARRTGLLEGTPVAIGNIDAHVAVPACGVTTSDQLVMIMGTSTCHLLLGDTAQRVEGICGVVKDGIVPGIWGYEAGQAGVGDLFAWYVDQSAPPAIHADARSARMTVHQLLEKRASALRPGECGLLALDWWSGCRSVLMDSDLSGLLVGVTLATKPHEIYRALIEATAFGTRQIIEAFTNKGIAIDELRACGGLAQKNPLLMQIYADVTGRPIHVAASEQTCALGAAMQGAVAAGVFPDIHAAASKMVRVPKVTYRPNPAHKPIYDQLHAEYIRLHDLFGRDASGTMKRLRHIALRSRA